jgi:hypothetical protein
MGAAPVLIPRMVTRREWLWAASFALLVMAFTSMPYLVAAGSQTPGWHFGGFLLAVEDANSYVAKMNEGAHGAWLFTLPYSSEPQQGVLVYSFFLVLGRLAGANHDTQVLVYHAARVVCGVALLLISYLFLAEFLPRPDQRRLGLLLVALGGGLGWLLTLLWPNGLLGSLPVDIISPEAFSYLVLFAFPHLAAARCLILLGLLAYLRGRGGLAGVALLGLGLIQPLSVVIVWVVVGAHLALSWWWEKRRGELAPWWRDVRNGLVLGLISAPMVVYTLYVLYADSVLRQWTAQNQLPSPSPVHYVLAYGVWLAAAVSGWRVLWRRQPRLALLAGGWLLSAPLLLYIPISTQRRLIEGVQLPLAALAVMGLTVALRRYRRWLMPLVLAATLPTALLLWLGALFAARVPAEPIFHPADQVQAFAWLAQNGQPGQVALSAYETGNALPAFSPLIAYIGHGSETIFLAAKAPQVAAFYRSATPDADRLALLAGGRIAYVVFGPHERALGDFDPSSAAYLALRFRAGNYSVYEVVR